jgi:hypothetical protein
MYKKFQPYNFFYTCHCGINHYHQQCTDQLLLRAKRHYQQSTLQLGFKHYPVQMERILAYNVSECGKAVLKYLIFFSAAVGYCTRLRDA